MTLIGIRLEGIMLQISSLFYSEFPQKLYHYAHYCAQNLLNILNFGGEFLQLSSLLQSKTSKMFIAYVYY